MYHCSCCCFVVFNVIYHLRVWPHCCWIAFNISPETIEVVFGQHERASGKVHAYRTKWYIVQMIHCTNFWQKYNFHRISSCKMYLFRLLSFSLSLSLSWVSQYAIRFKPLIICLITLLIYSRSNHLNGVPLLYPFNRFFCNCSKS